MRVRYAFRALGDRAGDVCERLLSLTSQYARHPATHLDANSAVRLVILTLSARSSAERSAPATRSRSLPATSFNFETRKPASSRILVRSTPSLVGFFTPASAGSRT